jgi:hypothetical protein
MKHARGGLVLLLLLGTAAAVRAQFVLPSFGGFGVSVSRHGHHSHVAGYLSAGYGRGWGWYDSPYYYPGAFSRVTVLQLYSPPPPVVITPPPTIVIAPPAEPQEPERPPRRPPEQLEPPQPKPPGDAGGGFRPVRGEDQKPAPRPPEPPREKEKPNEKPPELPRPPFPQADPKAESARQTALGLDVFAAAQYGRAAQRFRQATAINPQNARAHFFLAQAAVALGKYDEAVEAIQQGMRLEPDWPTASFRPVTLYNSNVADWPEHLQRLQEALARHPNDAALLFLSAYQLWFDGRQDEARPLFERAAAVAPDRSFSERFLLARPGKPAI